MAILALTLAVIAFQSSLESKIVKQMAPFTYKTQPIEKSEMGIRLKLLRETPIYGGGAQSPGVAGATAPTTPPKPTSVLRDEAIFLFSDKQMRIEWLASKNHSTTREVFLGQLDGKYVYAQGPIAELAYVAKGLPFKGGQDWRDIAIIGLTSQGPGYHGMNGEYFFNRTGDSSLPFLMKALEKKPKVTWGLIRAVGETSGPGSIPALEKLYKSKDYEIKKAAAYALISSPRKAEARKTLLDMLENGFYPQYVASVAAQNSWIEAIPILQKIKIDPERYGDLVAVMEAERLLRATGTESLREVYSQLLQGKDEEGKNTKDMIQQPDKEMAAAYALALRSTITKGGTSRARETGQLILDSLPKEAVEAVKARFKS